MNDIQKVEMTKLREQINHDVRKLVDKYRRIMDWDIPENDETRAGTLVIEEIRQALDRVAADDRTKPSA